jgi:hypothetical protein
MRISDVWIRASVLVLLAVGALVALGTTSTAGEISPPGAAELPFPVDEPHGDEPGTTQAEGDVARPSEAAVAEPVFHKSEGRDTTGWTSGVIVGDIPLTTSVLDKIQTISVVVDELKNVRVGGTPPWRKVVPVTLGIGTPTFEVRDVPFSDYGYVVRVHSPGLNGGQCTVNITQEHPFADDVALPITPGSPFSILLRDQDRAPIGATEIRMVPHLEPHGRSTLHGTSDNYGSVVFEDVLEGEYHVHLGPQAMPLMEPTVVHVQPGSFLRQGSTVLPQGTTILVPRGSPITAIVSQVGGWPVAGALVQLRKTDRRQATELEGETDHLGKVTFPNLLPGNWEIEISKPDFQRRLSQFEVKADAQPSEQRFEIVRLR